MAARTSASHTKSTGSAGAGAALGAAPWNRVSSGHYRRPVSLSPPAGSAPLSRRARKRSTTSAATFRRPASHRRRRSRRNHQPLAAGAARWPPRFRAPPGNAPRPPPPRCRAIASRPIAAVDGRRRVVIQRHLESLLRLTHHIRQALDIEQMLRADVVGGGIARRRAASQRHRRENVGGDAR